MRNRSLPILLRFIAAVLLIATIAVAIVQLRAGNFSVPTMWSMLLPVLSALAIASGLIALAAQLEQTTRGPDELSRSVGRMQQNLLDMMRRVDDVALATDRISKNRTPPPPPPPVNVTANLSPGQLDPILRAIAEVRELALLNDSERSARLTKMAQERRRMLVRQAIDHIERQDWTAANSALGTLEREHGDDTEVRRIRTQFQDARKGVEGGTVNRLRDEVEQLISNGAWEHAHRIAQKLCDDFPTNADAKRLCERVQREHDIHVETSVSRMVEELRHDIDRRMWRRAFMHAQRLLELYPHHPKTQRMSEQLQTLGENAEIEERQEMEVRIQELIRAHNFSEAIALSEELLGRFPESPQAEAIEKLLPRIQQLEREAAAPSGENS